jgi:hypothetical protein
MVRIGLTAAARREVIWIVPIRRDLHALTKCKANKSHKHDQCEKRSYPIWHGGSIWAASVGGFFILPIA